MYYYFFFRFPVRSIDLWKCVSCQRTMYLLPNYRQLATIVWLIVGNPNKCEIYWQNYQIYLAIEIWETLCFFSNLHKSLIALSKAFSVCSFFVMLTITPLCLASSCNIFHSFTSSIVKPICDASHSSITFLFSDCFPHFSHS